MKEVDGQVCPIKKVSFHPTTAANHSRLCGIRSQSRDIFVVHIPWQAATLSSVLSMWIWHRTCNGLPQLFKIVPLGMQAVSVAPYPVQANGSSYSVPLLPWSNRRSDIRCCLLANFLLGSAGNSQGRSLWPLFNISMFNREGDLHHVVGTLEARAQRGRRFHSLDDSSALALPKIISPYTWKFPIFRGEEKIFQNVIEYVIYSIALKGHYKFLLSWIIKCSTKDILLRKILKWNKRINNVAPWNTSDNINFWLKL